MGRDALERRFLFEHDEFPAFGRFIEWSPAVRRCDICCEFVLRGKEKHPQRRRGSRATYDRRKTRSASRIGLTTARAVCSLLSVKSSTEGEETRIHVDDAPLALRGDQR